MAIIRHVRYYRFQTAELAAADNSGANDISSAKEYLSAHFEEITLLHHKELIRRIIDKVVRNGEQLDLLV